MNNCLLSTTHLFRSLSSLSLSRTHTYTLSLSHAHSKCLTGSLRKASPLLFPWQLACIGIDDISWSPTYFALKKRSPMNFANAISPAEGWRHFSHSRGETEKRKRLSVWKTRQTFLFLLSSFNLVGARHYSRGAQWPVLSNRMDFGNETGQYIQLKRIKHDKPKRVLIIHALLSACGEICIPHLPMWIRVSAWIGVHLALPQSGKLNWGKKWNSVLIHAI